ncbi:Hypothetical predicted protein [Octopus vulgaris]|uniref:Uncharacterized protein n=1 Tax=Octopus vulgaris TaxID=6645 RepID=A0AA36BSV5_OCTVU|nr:Hypothetical predicted protein [Octopus vulgaris]
MNSLKIIYSGRVIKHLYVHTTKDDHPPELLAVTLTGSPLGHRKTAVDLSRIRTLNINGRNHAPLYFPSSSTPIRTAADVTKDNIVYMRDIMNICHFFETTWTE